MKYNQSRPEFELVSPCPLPTRITITPRAPHFVLIYSFNVVNSVITLLFIHYNTPTNNDVWILYNLKKWWPSLFLFLSLPCGYQCRFKRYIAKQTNSKTEETVPLWRQPAFPTTYLLSFLFFSMWQATNHVIRSSFFALIFSFFKDYNKNVRDLTFLSFLHFLSSSKVILLLPLLTWHLVCFLFFSFRCSKLRISGFGLSFFNFFFLYRL